MVASNFGGTIDCANKIFKCIFLPFGAKGFVALSTFVRLTQWLTVEQPKYESAEIEGEVKIGGNFTYTNKNDLP